jgi:hypothetical protein
MADSAIDTLVRALDEAYDTESWHGPNLRGSIRRLRDAHVIWRPGPQQHNIWEITLHAAYWKYIVLRRFTGGKKGAFPRKGSDWYPRPAGDPAESWKEDVKLLDEIHKKLRACVVGLKPEDLDIVPIGSTVPNGAIIRGIALHDVYHAGQIQTLRQLYTSSKPST